MDSEQLVSLLLSWTDSIPGFLDKINEFLDLTVLSVSTSTLVAEQVSNCRGTAMVLQCLTA